MAGSFKGQDAIIKHLNDLLSTQRDRFQLYLEVLNKQKDAIEHARVENILAYVEAGEKLAADIFAIQKVIEPLENATSVSETQEIVNIKAVLEHLRQNAILQSEENKALLSKRMALIACEIKSLQQNPMRSRISTPSFIDIEL